MKTKNYIFNMTSLIINRLKFHAPYCEAEEIDFEKIIEAGVDPTLPVFVFEKPLTKIMIKCFKNAKKNMKFNLVVPYALTKKIKDLDVIASCEKEIKKLNINYKSGLKFDLLNQENFIRINSNEIDKTLNGFFLESFKIVDDVSCFTREFMLSGNNVFAEFLNTSSDNKEIDFEINFNLGKGYFNFLRHQNCIEIVNLFSLEKLFFNFSSNVNKFLFSCVDGVENSSYARIYLKSKIILKPKQKKSFFFNLGSNKFLLHNRDEMDFFMTLADKKNKEKFDVQIISNNKCEQRLLNNILPKKIYMAWLLRQHDIESEKRYINLKEKFVIKKNDQYFLQNTSQLNELKLFNGSDYKVIYIIKNADFFGKPYLQIGDTKYIDKKTLSFKEISSKNQSIYVS